MSQVSKPPFACDTRPVVEYENNSLGCSLQGEETPYIILHVELVGFKKNQRDDRRKISFCDRRSPTPTVPLMGMIPMDDHL